MYICTAVPQLVQTEDAAAQALAEDPSVFEYDSLYDQMVEEKKNKNPKLLGNTKVRYCVCVHACTALTEPVLSRMLLQPKYIHALKKAAERRKLEGELVYEHMAQREIEKDQEQFKDKESFVTSAYKEKLAERRALEEELAREAAEEGEWSEVRRGYMQYC